MSRLQSLKLFVQQRLTAAVEDIFGHFERTIAECEEEMDLRHRKLLQVVSSPGTEVQQLLVAKEKVPTEQQEWSSSLDPEDPEPPHIKEEQEELWTSQEGEQLQGLEEADAKFSITPVKREEEEAQSSQLHQRQTEQTETEADGEDCGGPEPDRNSDPDKHPESDTDDSSEPETDDSEDWKQKKKHQSGSNSLKNVLDERCITDKHLCICSECGKRFGNRTNLKVHMLIHTGIRPFFCTLCHKRFPQKRKLKRHMKCHIPGKPYSCSVCKERFRYSGDVKRHMGSHTAETPSTRSQSRLIGD